MKTAKYVRLEVTKVIRETDQFVINHIFPPQHLRTAEGDYLQREGSVNGMTYEIEEVPIIKLSTLFEGAQDDVYIAYDKSVCDMLGIPIDYYKKHLNELQEQIKTISSYKNASLWQRMKYVFTGRV